MNFWALCSHLSSSPLSSGLLQSISLLINLCAPFTGALFLGTFVSFMLLRPFHCLTRFLLALHWNLFNTFLDSCLHPLIKGFYHTGCRVLLFSSANHQRVSSISALSQHIKSNICPFWAVSAICYPLAFLQRGNITERLTVFHQNNHSLHRTLCCTVKN